MTRVIVTSYIWTIFEIKTHKLHIDGLDPTNMVARDGQLQKSTNYIFKASPSKCQTDKLLVRTKSSTDI